ncbi:hypothetical protein MPSEU_000380500 [Mayamaea pseudoterrestris]|nr:hypothetical protein MPSEU_000380500 [Mayamaea pseudoterrestris]
MVLGVAAGSTYTLLTCFCLASRSGSFVQRLHFVRTRHSASFSSSMSQAPPATALVNDPLVQLHLPSPLILGSASFTRKLILKEMGVNYHILVRPINERSLGNRDTDKPSDLVLHLAQAKMDHLVSEIQAGRCDNDLPSQNEYIILTGDQVVTCNGKILEKPETVDEAKTMVAMYSKHPPSTVGSVVLMHLPSKLTVAGVDTATIYFKNEPNDGLVDRLLEEDAPILSCAGGLMVEHKLVKQYIERIDGTEDSVMGLSKKLVLRLLTELAEKLAAANGQ